MKSQKIVLFLFQFALTAPTGVIAAKNFQEMMADLMSLTHGAETLPDAWMNVSGDKVHLTYYYKALRSTPWIHCCLHRQLCDDQGMFVRIQIL